MLSVMASAAAGDKATHGLSNLPHKRPGRGRVQDLNGLKTNGHNLGKGRPNLSPLSERV